MEAIEGIFFILFAIGVFYLLIFAGASTLAPKKVKKQNALLLEKESCFAILIPAYKEEGVILETIHAALEQNYEAAHFRVVVIADHFKKDSLQKLRQENIILLEVCFENSSKAKSLQYAIEHINSLTDFKPLRLVILDADNMIGPSFLAQVNQSLNDSGFWALQTHRKSKNMDTPTAILDSASEEMNNRIFRKGHIRLGLPSALIGSGMVFDFAWFASHVSKLATAGEDKELELMLLQEKIFIDYLEQTWVLDEKIKNSRAFYQQRRRWISAQLYSLYLGLKSLAPAICSANWGYLDKVFQWMLPPRIVLIGLLFLIALGLSFWDLSLGLKWWGLLGVLLLALGLSLPLSYWKSRDFWKSGMGLPLIFFLMLANFFRTKGAVHTFIHTPHEKKEIV